MIVWLLIGGIAIAGFVWLLRYVTRRSDAPQSLARRSPALEVLGERYARGEINRDEYLEKRRDILG